MERLTLMRNKQEGCDALRNALVLVALGAGLALGGCSGGEPAPAPGTDDGEYAMVLEQLVAGARSGGASQEQLDILEGGPIAFEDYQDAVNRSLTCMRNAGIEVFGGGVSEVDGFPQIAYSFGAESAGRTEDQTIAIADECMNAHSLFIEGAYSTSPASVEAQEAAFAPYREALVSCVKENGADVEDGATKNRIIALAVKVQNETNIDCIEQSGYDG